MERAPFCHVDDLNTPADAQDRYAPALSGAVQLEFKGVAAVINNPQRLMRGLSEVKGV